MEIEAYTEKSFVLKGDTRMYKDEIKNLGGKWNTLLKCGPAWIFPNTKKENVENWLNLKSCNNK
jgi:hypothetical protein